MPWTHRGLAHSLRVHFVSFQTNWPHPRKEQSILIYCVQWTASICEMTCWREVITKLKLRRNRFWTIWIMILEMRLIKRRICSEPCSKYRCRLIAQLIIKRNRVGHFSHWLSGILFWMSCLAFSRSCKSHKIRWSWIESKSEAFRNVKGFSLLWKTIRSHNNWCSMFSELNTFIAWADHPVLDVSITNAIFVQWIDANKQCYTIQIYLNHKKRTENFRVNMSESEEQENPRKKIS